MAAKMTYLNPENISELFIVFLVEMEVVRNDILNNLYPDEKLPILNCSPSGSLQS